MIREEEIRQAALAYSFDTDGGVTGDLNTGRDDFMKGAEWADEHPAVIWHKVADGDIPRANKNCIFHYLGRMSKGFMRGDKSIFLDDDLTLSPNIREIDYWMEIPELPTE